MSDMSLTQPPSKVYGGEFEPDNINNPRTIIAKWVRPGSHVLDVGPGNGAISRWLRDQKQCTAVGIEYSQEAAAVAQPIFQKLIIGSIEDAAVVSQAAGLGPYDTIVFADVLEHLVDPWAVLRAMHTLLKPEGHILISVPNVANWMLRLNLLIGRFDYTDGFIMDRTHLRWFTRRTARAMATSSGYEVVEVATVYKPRFLRFWPSLMGYQTVLNIKPHAA
jgi:2-polyprenyl-3-methyl-5-hydroxy-6-metoxy-1,4-benzoquinol methylase